MSNTDFAIPYELRNALGLVPDFSLHQSTAQKPAYVDYTKGLRREWVPPGMSVPEAAVVAEVWEHNQALHSSCVEIFLQGEDFLLTYDK